MGARTFKELRVWQEARQVELAIYRVTRGFPPEERYCMIPQMRRAAFSIGANIAEGFGRWTPKDRARFLEIAKSSAEEVRHYLSLAVDLAYLKPDPALDERLDTLCAMLYRARQSVLGYGTR